MHLGNQSGAGIRARRPHASAAASFVEGRRARAEEFSYKHGQGAEGWGHSHHKTTAGPRDFEVCVPKPAADAISATAVQITASHRRTMCGVKSTPHQHRITTASTASPFPPQRPFFHTKIILPAKRNTAIITVYGGPGLHFFVKNTFRGPGPMR